MSPANTKHACVQHCVQRRPNVFDVGPTLYKCYTNILCLLGFDSQKQSSNPLIFDVFGTNCSFDSFSSVSEVEIDKIIKQSPSECCDSDTGV